MNWLKVSFGLLENGLKNVLEEVNDAFEVEFWAEQVEEDILAFNFVDLGDLVDEFV